MTVTPSVLTRASAAAAVAAGVIFVGVQVAHPHLDATSVTTTEVMVRNSLKVLMAALALAGISGMYLSQVRRNGVWGLVGYLVLSAGYLLILGTTLALAVVLPTVAESNPAYVEDVIAAVVGDTPSGDVGAFATVLRVQGFAYLVGGLVFGIALFRAGVLARWASALLAVGGLVSAALTFLPDAFYRLIAYPNGIALVGLGLSLWMSTRTAPEAAGRARPASSVAAGA
jgi:hypothetical protein